MAPPEKITAEYYKEVDQKTKMLEKSKQQPFVPIGIAGFIGMLGYGVYSFKNKGKMSTSIFLMHLRVKAQTMVVGAMTLGIAATLVKDYWEKNISKHQ